MFFAKKVVPQSPVIRKFHNVFKQSMVRLTVEVVGLYCRHLWGSDVTSVLFSGGKGKQANAAKDKRGSRGLS